jgi:hypothetical protein
VAATLSIKQKMGAFLQSNPSIKFILFGGKGGLGKTTLSAATSYWLAKSGRKGCIFSTDPQASLTDIFERKIFGQGEVEIAPNLYALEIDADKRIAEYQAEIRQKIKDMYKIDAIPVEVEDYIISSYAVPAMAESATFDSVKLTSSDTDSAPYDPGTHASRVTYASGYVVRLAAAEAKRNLFRVAGEMLGESPDDLVVKDGVVSSKGTRDKRVTVAEVATAAQLPSVVITDKGPQFTIKQKGSVLSVASAAPPSNPTPTAALFVEVSVDTETGEVRVRRAVSAHDLGKAINPMAAEGQVEGGFTQGMGYALMENMLFDPESGSCMTVDFLDYKIPTASETPAIESILLERTEQTGPYGAKGIGEPPIIVPAPAIANAVYNAAGVRIRDLPITPEKVLRALGKVP